MNKSGLEIWGIHGSCQTSVNKANFEQERKRNKAKRAYRPAGPKSYIHR